MNLKKGLQSSITRSMVARASREAVRDGADFLLESSMDFTGRKESGYEYKHWTPLWIPFIQASTGIWDQDFTAFPAANGTLPATRVIAPGQSFDFNVICPKDHPFLLLDVKTIATPVDGGSRFQAVFDMATQPYLTMKYLFPNDADMITSVHAVSPAGRPVWGGLQNVTGMINAAATIGPEPHLERVPLSNTQTVRSGKGAARHGLLFPVEGVCRVTVENRRAAGSMDVNGALFGYVLLA